MSTPANAPAPDELEPTVPAESPSLEGVPDGPLTVVNHFALREVADYGDGRSDPGTGAEALLRYAAVSGPCLERVGGRFLATAVPSTALWGTDEDWDLLVVASYPDREALASLLADPAYQQAFVHRRAAVARQRVVVAATIG